MKELSMKDFYTFHSKGYLTTVSVFPDRNRYFQKFDANTFMNEKIIKGDWSGLEFPLIFHQTHEGKRFRDVLDMRWPSAYLISDRMKNILEENKITGWKSYPVVIYDKKGGIIKGYNGFSIVGRSGPLDLKNQPIEPVIDDNGHITEYKEYVGGWFDANTWDGCDVFIQDNSLRIIITDRLHKILKKEKITAIECERFSDLRWECEYYK